MSQFFENIKIENFKSLRNVELKDCSRINLFIGKPNVGKSNILEALSFFFIAHNAVTSRFNNALNWYIRYETESELFFNGKVEDNNFINIHTNLANCKVIYNNFEGLTIEIEADNIKTETIIKLDERMSVPTMKNMQPYAKSFKKVKKYTFDYERQSRIMRIGAKSSSRYRLPFLTPPFGNNLVDILEQNIELSNECIKFFKNYDLDLVFDKAGNTLKVMKTSKNGEDSIKRFFLMPYSSMADTLQRVIFYKTAIASNKDSILLFEEPEAHSFPPYIVHITQEIIHSVSNQFFITTHSPFVLNDFLENAREELSIYIVDWQDDETIVKKLSHEQLHEIYQYGIDLFTNLETFI